MGLNLSAFLAQPENENSVPTKLEEKVHPSNAIKVAKQAQKRKAAVDPKPLLEKPPAQPIHDDNEIPIIEPPPQRGSITMYPTNVQFCPPHQTLKQEISKLISRHRKDDIVELMFESLTWEETMLAFSNICTNKAIAFRKRGNHKKDREWLKRAQRFHQETGLDLQDYGVNDVEE